MPDFDSARSLMIARGNEARSVRVMAIDLTVIGSVRVSVDERVTGEKEESLARPLIYSRRRSRHRWNEPILGPRVITDRARFLSSSPTDSDTDLGAQRITW